MRVPRVGVTAVAPLAGVVCRRAVMSLLALSLAACSVQTVAGLNGGNVSLTTGATVYSSGEVVQVTITNNTSLEFESGACFEQLDLLVGNRWVTATVPGRSCDAILLTYAAGQSRTLPFSLPLNAAAGTYRLRLSSLRLEDGRRLSDDVKVTNAFEVRGPIFTTGG